MPLILWLIFCYDSPYKKARLNKSLNNIHSVLFFYFQSNFPSLSSTINDSPSQKLSQLNIILKEGDLGLSLINKNDRG